MEAPKSLRTARIILYIQGILGVIGAVLLFAVLGASPSSAVPGWVIGVIVLSLVAAVLLVVAAATIVSPARKWPWTLAVVVEAFAVLSGLINVFTGAVQALVGVALGVVVLMHLSRAEVREYLGLSRPSIDKAWESEDDRFPQD
jgi:Mg2+/Co2+ transporter CorB